MMTNSKIKNDPTLQEIVERLIQTFNPESIYLFGSVARGQQGPDSDYDLLVIVSQMTEPKYKLAQKAQRALWRVPKGADVLVITRTEFDEAATVTCSLPATVLREGKELYVAA